ncbi:methyltransferase domain-containing protein [Labrenzia sp. PHM005]|uniref:methyltransferase domain-containing protein n=1 Tax=Labrenzia sp. PHM005 TaxID=2590016 RepID=UPI00143CC357|nr:methyltransferase domain-containing protein [Labrenzia sp. PHM005]
MKYFAHAYQNADASSDAELDEMRNLLGIMAAHPDFQAYKRNSYDALDLKPDAKVADVACGLGFDLPYLKDRVSEGTVTGFDLSEKFLAAAESRINAVNGRADPSILFKQSDIQTIDSKPGVFDAVRVDRSLQHVSSPETAISEMLRIVRPGGILCAAEPDWGSFVIGSSYPEIADKVVSAYAQALINPRIGRDLIDLIGSRTALTHHSVHPLLLKTLPDASRICVLEDITARCQEAGTITSKERTAFWQDLKERDASGRCFALLNIHLVAGRKP